MTRSMAPPPPTARFQFINLAPLTESTPWEVCHLCRSCGSGVAPQTCSTAGRATARRRSGGFRVRSRFIVGAEFAAEADALFHVEDMAGFGQAIDEGGGQVVVLEKGTPLAEAQ